MPSELHQHADSTYKKVVFLDRDGTLNVDHGYVHRSEEWQFTDRAVEALRLLSQQEFKLAVVTNQSGIAAGKYSADDVRVLQDFVQHQLKTLGLRIDAFAFCPHAPDDNCLCRKPRVGMVADVCSQIGKRIDYQSSWTIGDKPTDIGFGVALGTRTALIRSRYWSPHDPELEPTSVIPGTDVILQSIERPTGEGFSNRAVGRIGWRPCRPTIIVDSLYDAAKEIISTSQNVENR